MVQLTSLSVAGINAPTLTGAKEGQRCARIDFGAS
jgi:hypothetical protein